MKDLKKYEKRIVLYLDILGFSNSVEQSENDSDLMQDIYKALKNIYNEKDNNYRGPLKGVDVGRQISVFSDNIVMSEPFSERGSFFYFVYAAYWAINEILNDGFLVRGAITIGELYHDQEVVFGPALNKAYNLESQLAIFPRVIIAQEDFDLGLQNALYNDINEERAYLSPVLEKDVDGFWFVKFFTKKHDFDDRDVYINLLFKLKSIIEKGLNNKNLRIRAKYEWLKEKYNALYDGIMDARAPGKIYN